MIRIEECSEASDWDEEVLARGGHPLQLWGWGGINAAHGWRVVRVLAYRGEEIIGVAQILLKKLTAPLNYSAYISRGPVVDDEKDREAVLDALAGFVKNTYHPVVLTIEPDWEGDFEAKGWQKSDNSILIAHTLILDLKTSKDNLMAGMSKKTRQYIRKSVDDGVEVRKLIQNKDVAECLDMYRQTAKAQFAIHNEHYYFDVFQKLGDHSLIFGAFVKGELVAFLWLAISSDTAFELYEGSNDVGQEVGADYALKWQAVQTMKKWGIQRYDLNGLPSDSLSTFKQGFADHENYLVGTYDKPLSPLYNVWRHGMPLGKKILRKLRNR